MKPILTMLTFAAMAWGAAQIAAADLTRVELTDPSRAVELRVEIEWGSIRIVGDTSATGVTVKAVADQPGEIEGGLIAVAEEDNLVIVSQVALREGVFRSAHLEITTPLVTSMSLKMNRGGDVWIRDVRGLVEVTNLNGSVELVGVSGAAAVNTSNGSINAGFAEVDPDRDMIFTSLNGSVELCMPADLSGRVHLTTAGDPIRSDFPVVREKAAAVVAPGETRTVDRSKVRGRIGSGEAMLRASTLNGEIYLERCE